MQAAIDLAVYDLLEHLNYRFSLLGGAAMTRIPSYYATGVDPRRVARLVESSRRLSSPLGESGWPSC